MTTNQLVSSSRVDLDVEAAFDWYESERPGLGLEFLEELRRVYDRIVKRPTSYQIVRGSIRRALTHRFPYAAYFAIENEAVIILAVLHVSRDPAEWQRR